MAGHRDEGCKYQTDLPALRAQSSQPLLMLQGEGRGRGGKHPGVREEIVFFTLYPNSSWQELPSSCLGIRSLI